MRRRLVTAVSVALLWAAACSGSDGNSDGPIDTTAPAAEPTTDAEAVADPDPDQPVDTTASVPTSEPGGSQAPPDDFCDAIGAIRSADFELEETFGDEARALFADVSSSAPPAIADEVATVVDTLDAIAEIGISEDEDDPVAIDAAFEILLDPAYLEANETLVAYTSETCGIDLAAGDELEVEQLDLDELDPEGSDDDLDDDGG